MEGHTATTAALERSTNGGIFSPVDRWPSKNQALPCSLYYTLLINLEGSHYNEGSNEKTRARVRRNGRHAGAKP